MVKVTCINDKNRPKEIPEFDWVKEGETYHVTHISLQVNQVEGGMIVAGCDIYEKPLSLDRHTPYECFRLSRFGCSKEDLELMIQLIIDCHNLDKDIATKILKETELQEL
jgi:hypothetical protein